MDLLVRHRAAAENVDQEVWCQQFVSLRAWRCIFLLLLFPLQRFSSPPLPVFVAQCTCGRTAEPGPINPRPPAHAVCDEYWQSVGCSLSPRVRRGLTLLLRRV